MRNAEGKIVRDQGDVQYQWVIKDPSLLKISTDAYCFYGIKPPCPTLHAEVRGVKAGYTMVTLYVKRSSDDLVLTSTSVPILIKEGSASATPPATLSLHPIRYLPLSALLSPNISGQVGVIEIKVPPLDVEDYQRIRKIQLKINPYRTGYGDNYFLVAERRQRDLYLTFTPLATATRRPLIENQDYTRTVAPDGLGEKLVLLHKKDIGEKGFLTVYLKDFRLRRPGNIKISLSFYSNEESLPLIAGSTNLQIYPVQIPQLRRPLPPPRLPITHHFLLQPV